MSGVTAKLAQLVSEVDFDDLPPSTVQKVKEILLDSIGCALGARVTERAKIAMQLGEAFGIKSEATVIGYRKMSCPAASFVNGELINCLDFDAVGPLLAHVAPMVIPPVLAIGEKKKASGKDLITSIAVGMEVGNRVGGSLSGLKWPKDEPPYYEEAPRASINTAIFGGIAGAGKLLGLNVEQIRSAFGVGGTSTPVPGNVKWEYLDEGNNVSLKYGCWTGWVAMLGTITTIATQKGFRGDVTILDGKYGYWQMYGSPFFKEDLVLDGFGEVWYLEKINFKAYPACYINHTAIQGIECLVRENSIKPETIDEILVYADPIQNTPNRWPPGIKTQEDAQFANAYLYAQAACHEDRPGPQWQLQSSMEDPKVNSLMPKVKVKPYPEADKILTEKAKLGGLTVLWNSIVEISACGKKFTKEVAVPKGSPDSPMSISELEAKFRHNASYSMLPGNVVKDAIQMIGELEKLGDITKLTKLLAVN